MSQLIQCPNDSLALVPGLPQLSRLDFSYLTSRYGGLPSLNRENVASYVECLAHLRNFAAGARINPARVSNPAVWVGPNRIAIPGREYFTSRPALTMSDLRGLAARAEATSNHRLRSLPPTAREFFGVIHPCSGNKFSTTTARCLLRA